MTPFEQIVFVYGRICEVNSEPIARVGIPEDVVREAFADRGLVADPLLVEIYGWHNGIYHLNAFLHFLSMDDALELHRMFEELLADRDDLPWERTWFPVIDINGDTQILLDLHGGRLVGIDLEANNVWNIAPDYRVFLDAIHAVFDRGHYEYCRASGAISVDKRAWSSAAKEHGLVPARFWNAEHDF